MITYQYPLAWPVGIPRTSTPIRSKFDTAEERVKRNLENQLFLMRATNIIVTCNVELRRDGKPYVGQRISDTGVAVYFTRKGAEQCIACDKWDSVRDNLQAVGKTIEALRGIERWGTGEMVDAAFRGFTAIPANAGSGSVIVPPRPWYEVLHVSPDAPQAVIDAAYKAMLKSTHPDVGGDQASFEEAQRAYKEGSNR